MDGSVTPQELAMAQALAVDRFAAEVIGAMRAKGIEPILLKGSTLADWLYPGDVRPYGDADLLVAPAQVMDSATVLEGLGFVPVQEHVSPHAHPWIRSADGAQVDLHARLHGPTTAPERVWHELQGWTTVEPLMSIPVRTLNLAGRSLQVALHAIQHVEHAKPREDLRRAIARAPETAWRGAEQLADRIGALHILAHGLALEPTGRELVDRLPLARAALVADEAGAPLAVGFARLAGARGVGGKLRVVDEAVRTAGIRTLLERTPRTVWALWRAQRVKRRP